MSNGTKVYEGAEIAFEKLSPRNGDTMVISFPADIDPDQMVEFGIEMDSVIPEGVTVLCLRGGMTVELLSEENMNSVGWYKMGTIQ